MCKDDTGNNMLNLNEQDAQKKKNLNEQRVDEIRVKSNSGD